MSRILYIVLLIIMGGLYSGGAISQTPSEMFCDAGYTLNTGNMTCEQDVTMPASQQTSEYCPSGYSRSGNSCYRYDYKVKELVKSYKNATIHCPSSHPNQSTYNGSLWDWKCFSERIPSDNGSCPSGYSLTPAGYCADYVAFQSYECPIGYTVQSDGRCMTSSYQCVNSTEVGGQCRYTTYKALITNTRYVCPSSDYELQPGNVCYRLLTHKPNDINPPSILLVDDGGEIRSSSFLFKAHIVDNLDTEPTVRGVVIKGGDEYEMVSTKRGNEYTFTLNTFSSEIGFMEEELEVKVYASDFSNNVNEVYGSFLYKPKHVNLKDGMNGSIHIPAIGKVVYRPNSEKTIVTEPITIDGSNNLTGLQAVYVAWSGSKPLVVDGNIIQPDGNMTGIGLYNFTDTNGSLELDVASSDLERDSGKIKINIENPAAPFFVGEVVIWKPELVVNNDSTATAYFGNAVGRISASDNSICRVINDNQIKGEIDAIKDPVCVIEPKEKNGVSLSKNANNGNIIVRPYVEGNVEVEYDIYFPNGNGQKELLSTNYFEFESVPENMKFSFKEDGKVYHGISEFTAELINDNDLCSLSTNPNGLNNSPDMKSSKCVVEWGAFPESLSINTRMYNFSEPVVIGKALEVGSVDVGFKVYIYDDKLIRYDLGNYSSSIIVAMPDKPKVELLADNYRYADNIYVVPMDSRTLGDVKFSALPAPLETTIEIDGEIYSKETSGKYMTENQTVTRKVPMFEKKVWSETEFTFKAAYHELQEINESNQIKVVTSPSSMVRPEIILKDNSAVNTDAMVVKVRMKDYRQSDAEYDVDKIGVWETRLINQVSATEFEPLTEYSMIDENGEVVFNLELKDVEKSYLRIQAESRLVSPIVGYERIEKTASPRFVTVLKGEAIDGEINSKRLSGPAPITVATKLSLDDREMYRALGEVQWKLRKVGGDWDVFTPEKQPALSFFNTFEKGHYELKALMTNKNSGITSETEMIEVVAYDRVRVELIGAEKVFPGKQVELVARGFINDTAISDDEIVYEWSIDGGKTFDLGTNILRLESDEPTRFRVQVRAKTLDVPEGDMSAYITTKKTVEYVKPRAPKVSITGPRRVEVGKEYKYVAKVSVPYKGMNNAITGYFILPDGSEFYGSELLYIPTENDLTAGKVEVRYKAWMNDYPDNIQDVKSLARVWKYVWPEFAINLQSNAKVAPAEIKASIRPVGFRGQLDTPSYSWELPEGAILKEARNETSRVFSVNEPGNFLITVIVTDERGNERVVEKELSLEQSVPYTVDLTFSGSNKYNREPLSVVVRPYISGGHPRDKIANMEYLIDGTKMEGTGRYGRATLNSGEHNIELKLTTEMGVEKNTAIRIDVVPNQMPHCDISVRESSISWSVYAECEDDDGRLKEYDWLIDSEPVANKSKRITISKRGYAELPQVTLTGVDDAGGRSEPVSLH